MSYRLWITERTNKEQGKLKGFDVSTLAHNIEYTTSLYGQAGKLTFTLEKDPNGVLELELGKCVYFWNGEFEIFKGYIFKIGTDKSEKYSITAYDNMRYLQNHDYRCIGEGDKTLADMFKEICTALNIPYAITGEAAKPTIEKLHKHNWQDVSYFDILKDCIDEMSVRSIQKERDFVVEGSGEVSDKIDLSKTPVKYVIRCVFGTVELTDINYIVKGWNTENIAATVASGAYTEYTTDKAMGGKTTGTTLNASPLIIGDNSLMTNYSYDIDIDTNTYNEVMFIESGDKKKTEEAQKQYGAQIRKDWVDQIRNGNASDAEIEHAYDEYLAGHYPLENRKLGEKTKAEFEKVKARREAEANAVKSTDSIKGQSENVYPCVAMGRDEESIKKYGLLRQVRTVNAGATKAQLEEYIKLVMYETKNISKSLKIEALGFDGMNAGDGFLLEIRKLGMYDKTEWYKSIGRVDTQNFDTRIMVYIISATHHYGENVHTMSLDVAIPDKISELLK